MKPNSPNALKTALASQTVSVVIDASGDAFKFYSSGIIPKSACGTDLNQAVLAVGYNINNGQEYYKAKNSWGRDWGENGYFRVARSTENDAGTCGIQAMPSYPGV